MCGCDAADKREAITLKRMRDISSAFVVVLQETGKTPTKLTDLNDHYTDSEPGHEYLDGWLRKFEFNGETSELRSLGADGMPGTPDDIVQELPLNRQ